MDRPFRFWMVRWGSILSLAVGAVSCPGAVIYSANMDTNPGWTTSGSWNWGTPTGIAGDPSSGYTGTKVYGYNLSGAYENNLPATYWLKTGAINCYGYTGVHLKFYRWLTVLSGDYAYLSVSNNGSTWTDIWPANSTILDYSWVSQDFDISAYADNKTTVYVRWGMGPTDFYTSRGGWNIDDVQVTTGSPAVTSLAPNSGPDNGSVDVTNLAGKNFQAAATVQLVKSGQTPIIATNVVVVSSTKITCTFDLAGHAAGTWDVLVTNPDTLWGLLVGGFTIGPPVITSITPNAGVNTGSVSITNLAGTSFLTGATVKLTKTGQSDINATGVSVVNGIKITCSLNLTGKTAGYWNVVVTNPDNQTGTLTEGFQVQYPAPTVTAITPNVGPSNGSVNITNLAGTNFQSGASVKLTQSGQSDVDATNVNVINAGQITCTFTFANAPAGLWNVVVTNPDNQTGTKSFAFTVHVPTILYVDAQATGSNNGASWANALTSLVSGLSGAQIGDQVWVAEGTYKPSTSSQTATFQLKNGVSLYGGFQGVTPAPPGLPSGETEVGQRDWKAHRTILSGDRNGNDGPNFVNHRENIYHVVTGSGTDATAVLDGFTITGGNATADYSLYPNYLGGGMYNVTGNPTVRNCTFVENSGDTGGAIYNYSGSNPTLINCAFIRNRTHHWTTAGKEDNGTAGAGIYNNQNNLTLVNCVLAGNVARKGGGIYSEHSCNVTAVNCAFSGNAARYDALSAGGAIYSWDACNVTATNCSFIGNFAWYDGGGVYSYGSGSTVRASNCLFWDNSIQNGVSAVSKAQQAQLDGGGITINYSCVQSWWGDLGGVGNFGDDPLFLDPDGPDNVYGTDDDNFTVAAGSPILDAGDNTRIPTDTSDLDGDGNTSERIPVDLKGNSRFSDDLTRVATGITDLPDYPSCVDLGACEGHGALEGRVIYVDAQAAGGDNGTAWTDAYRQLQSALAVCQPGDQIWVAQGTYKPDYDLVTHQHTLDNTSSFELRFGVRLYGGFPTGGGEWENRNPSLYATILTGDLNDNDTPVSSPLNLSNHPARAFDNSRHVIQSHGVNGTAVLDGFTIRGGYAAGSENSEENVGGALWNQDYSCPALVNCLFFDNWAGQGGAICNEFSCSPSLRDCQFHRNGAGYGGGIYNDFSISTLRNCVFSGNAAYYFGGGMYNNYHSKPPITHCLFSGNWTHDGDGGGVYNNTECDAVFSHCVFSRNIAAGWGGGIASSWSHPRVSNCILWDNGGGTESHQLSYSDVNPVVNYTCVQGWTGTLGGTGNLATDPRFMDADGPDNVSGTSDDNLRLSSGSPCIDAGDNRAVPIDITSDLDGNARFADDPFTMDTGYGSAPIVDLGAYEYNPPRWTVTGLVTLGGFSGDSGTISLSVELRRHGGGVDNRTVSLDTQGNYLLENVATGTYDLAFKAEHWLRKVVANVTVDGNVSGIGANLLNGDADGNNGVTPEDLSLVLASLDHIDTDPDYDARADIDGDHAVTSTDLSIGLSNLDQTGDP